MPDWDPRPVLGRIDKELPRTLRFTKACEARESDSRTFWEMRRAFVALTLWQIACFEKSGICAQRRDSFRRLVKQT